MREEGFYWVKTKQGPWSESEWEVLRWDSESGWDEGDFSFEDDNYEEIDERRLVRGA